MTPKVLHIIDHNGLGGAQQMVRGILRRRNNDVVLPLRFKTPNFFSTPFYDGNSRWQYSIAHSLFIFFQLGSILAEVHADILHCHLQASWLAGVLSRKLCVEKGIHLVFHEHNPYAAHSPFYRSMARTASRYGFIIAVSQHIYDRLLQAGIAEQRLHLIPNFIELPTGDHSLSISSVKLQKPANKKVIGIAGRLVPEKGWRQALQALQRLSSPQVELWIAGSGKDEPRARRWAVQHGIHECVRFLGSLTDMDAFYQAIDVFLHPALEEPFGLAPLEAQAYGKPVVAYRFEGSAELFGESALLSPLGDVPALADSMSLLLTDISLQNSLRESGFSNVQRFSPAVFFPKLEAFYEIVMGADV